MDHTVESLLGKIIANGSLLSSLIKVLPLEALQALEMELGRDVDFGKGFLLGQSCSDQTIAGFEHQADANLAMVQSALANKEALQDTDAMARWMKGANPTD